MGYSISSPNHNLNASVILDDFVQGSHMHLLSISHAGHMQEKKSKKEGKDGGKSERKRELKVSKAILTCPKHGRIFAYGVFENGTPF